MKLQDAVVHSIRNYPSLYKDVNFEKSRLKVLNQFFFVIGNGMEWAETEFPEGGGYLVDPKYKRDRKTDEWVRIMDKPYGMIKEKPLPKDYFDTIVYYVYGNSRPLDVHIKKGEFGTDALYRFPKPKEYKPVQDVSPELLERLKDVLSDKPKLYEAESRGEFSPYPLSIYSAIRELYDEDRFIQPDWLAGMIDIAKAALEYYNDPERYKENIYAPSEGRIKSDLRYFQDRFKKDGAKGVADLRKTWSYDPSEEVPTEEEIREKKTKSFSNFLIEQTTFLNNFLEKYK